jgi:hypothetical protein
MPGVSRKRPAFPELLPRYGMMACWNTKGLARSARKMVGGNSLVAILLHWLTTSRCHPRPQFHELHPQVLQGAFVVGDLTLDIRQLEFKQPDFNFRRHWRPQMPEPVWPEPPAAPQPQGSDNLMAGERELTTGLLAKEASFRLKIRTRERTSQAQERAPRSRARGLRSRAHTVGAGLKPVALTRWVFLLALPGAASF